MRDKFASAKALDDEVSGMPTIHKSEKQIIETHEQQKEKPKPQATNVEREEGYLLLLRESLKHELKIAALQQKMTIKHSINDMTIHRD